MSDWSHAKLCVCGLFFLIIGVCLEVENTIMNHSSEKNSMIKWCLILELIKMKAQALISPLVASFSLLLSSSHFPPPPSLHGQITCSSQAHILSIYRLWEERERITAILTPWLVGHRKFLLLQHFPSCGPWPSLWWVTAKCSLLWHKASTHLTDCRFCEYRGKAILVCSSNWKWLSEASRRPEAHRGPWRLLQAPKGLRNPLLVWQANQKWTQICRLTCLQGVLEWIPLGEKGQTVQFPVCFRKAFKGPQKAMEWVADLARTRSSLQRLCNEHRVVTHHRVQGGSQHWNV